MKVLIGCEPRLVKGFPKYLVTCSGEVISLHGARPRSMSPGTDTKGYLGVTLCGEAKSRRVVRIHRLVAETFIPNPSGLPCVRHLDGNPKNNHIANLAWGTYKDNEMDKVGHGTWDTRRDGGKLSMENASAIRTAYEMGWSQKRLAELFEVSRPTITRIVNGSIWK